MVPVSQSRVPKCTRLAKNCQVLQKPSLRPEVFSLFKRPLSHISSDVQAERCCETHFGHGLKEYTSGYRTTKTPGVGFLADESQLMRVFYVSCLGAMTVNWGTRPGGEWSFLEKEDLYNSSLKGRRGWKYILRWLPTSTQLLTTLPWIRQDSSKFYQVITMCYMLVTRIEIAQLHPSFPGENTVERSTASKQREGSLWESRPLITTKELAIEPDRPGLTLAPAHMKWEVLITTPTFQFRFPDL